MKAAIFGAGPCGLSAALELAKHNIELTIVEKESSIGGLCKTVSRDGYRFDLGGHRFISKDIELINDIKALMDDQLLTRSRKSVIRFRDREYDYPINFLNVLRQSSLSMTLEFSLGYLSFSTGFFKSTSPENSFDKWADINFGKPLNNYFFKPYTEKLWGIPASSLSDQWAAQRISVLNARDLLLKSIGLSNGARRAYASKYLYPKQGIGSIFDMMSGKIKNSTGEILTGAEPIKFETKGNRIDKVLIKDRNGVERYIKAERYLSTIPLDKLLRLTGHNNVPPLNYRSLRFINIKLNCENFSPNTWIYVPEKGFIMTRIQEPKRRSPFNAPYGETSIILEIPCAKGDSIWSMEDDILLDRVVKDLKILRLDIKGKIAGYFSTYAEHAYPCYKISSLKNLEEMRRTVNKFENLTSLGRQGLFQYIFMDRAMLMGREWAKKIIGINDNNKIDEIDNETMLIEAQSIA